MNRAVLSREVISLPPDFAACVSAHASRMTRRRTYHLQFNPNLAQWRLAQAHDVFVRVWHLQSLLDEVGFPARVGATIENWRIAHAAFVAPIAFALFRVGVDPASMHLMILAIRQPFTALPRQEMCDLADRYRNCGRDVAPGAPAS